MKKKYLAIGLIIILGILCYANSFSNPFIWDDHSLVVNNPYIKDVRLVKNIFTKDIAYGTQSSNFYRPIQSLSFELDYYLWGLNPFGFHLSNLLLHIAAAIAIFLTFSLLFTGAKFIPLITALLFVSHPIQTEAVTYISGRADSLATLFMFLAILFYLKYSRNHKIISITAAIVSFIFAILSKEMALILPFLILLCDISFSNDKIRLRDKVKTHYLPFALVAVAYIGLRATLLNFLDHPLFLSSTSLGLRILTAAKTFIAYLRLLILPFNLHMERSMPFVSSIADKGVWPSLLLLTLMIALIVRSYKRSRISFFAGTWFFLALLPVSNLVPLNANMAEHWLYLPSLGLLLLIALAAQKLLEKGKLLKVVTVVLLLGLLTFYSSLTIKRNRDWQDPEIFFKSTLRSAPQSVEAHNCLGVVYIQQKKIKLAINEFKQAIHADPYNYKSYGNLGSALHEQQKYGLAISVYKKAIKLNPDIAGLYNNLGNVYIDNKNWQEAHKMFKQALGLYPEFALAFTNLGRVYYSIGKIDLAVQMHKKAIKLQPSLPPAHYNLAIAYQEQKKYDLTIEEYKKVISLDPMYINAYLNLGTAYNIVGYLDQAIAEYRKALEINPSFFPAYYNLGVVYYRKQDYLQAKKNFLQALSLNPRNEGSQKFLKEIEQLGYKK